MTDDRYPTSTTIWIWLMLLLGLGLACAWLPFGRTTAVFAIFTVAVVKAALVLRHYMHLRSEGLLVYAIAAIPVLLVIGMTLSLVPDIVFNR